MCLQDVGKHMACAFHLRVCVCACVWVCVVCGVCCVEGVCVCVFVFVYA